MRTKVKPKSTSKRGTNLEKDKSLTKNPSSQNSRKTKTGEEDLQTKLSDETEPILIDRRDENTEEIIEAVSTNSITPKLEQGFDSDDARSEYLDDEEYLEDSDSSLWRKEEESLIQTNIKCKNGLLQLLDFAADKQAIKKEISGSTDFESDDYFSENEELFRNVKKELNVEPETKDCKANKPVKKYIKKRYPPKPGGYCCNYCSSSFDKLKVLTQHMKTNHSHVYLTCADCNKTFKARKNLIQHLILHTNKGVKEFTCEICNATFIEKRRLNLHKLIHLEKKPIQCGICKKTFSHRSNYSRHLLTHSGLRPFKCECGRDFTNSTKLKNHKKVHIVPPTKKSQKPIE